MSVWLMHGDCVQQMKNIPDACVDSVVCDPPYGLSFMGKKWDYDVPGVDVWAECLRVLKPGGHLLAFAGTRTQHRMAVRIEDAGFEIRDMIAWVYGSGFPKSLDVSKAIDKAARGVPQGGADPTSINHGKFKGGCSNENPAGRGFGAGPGHFMAEPGAKSDRELVDAARQWQGWGTALKPALEPITVARKPLAGTVADNVQQFGTGAINIDGCRVAAMDGENRARPPRTPNEILGGGKGTNLTASEHNDAGRFPANLIHDGGEPADLLGGAARFFYCAKASKADRDAGLDDLEGRANQGVGALRDGYREAAPRKNNHPTVKPTDLMRYLCRLVTPPGGVVLDPFMGSGSTGRAARLEGFQFIGVERDPAYFEIAQRRVNAGL